MGVEYYSYFSSISPFINFQNILNQTANVKKQEYLINQEIKAKYQYYYQNLNNKNLVKDEAKEASLYTPNNYSNSQGVLYDRNGVMLSSGEDSVFAQQNYYSFLDSNGNVIPKEKLMLYQNLQNSNEVEESLLRKPQPQSMNQEFSLGKRPQDIPELASKKELKNYSHPMMMMVNSKVAHPNGLRSNPSDKTRPKPQTYPALPQKKVNNVHPCVVVPPLESATMTDYSQLFIQQQQQQHLQQQLNHSNTFDYLQLHHHQDSNFYLHYNQQNQYQHQQQNQNVDNYLQFIQQTQKQSNLCHSNNNNNNNHNNGNGNNYSQFKQQPQPQSQQNQHHANEYSTEVYSSPQSHNVSEPQNDEICMSYRNLVNHKLNPKFSSQYRLKEELGSGGFGFVLAAENIQTGQEVAVKFIFKNKIPSCSWVLDKQSGFIPMECYIMKRLNHPNIISYIDSFEDAKYFYIVMELHGSSWTSKEGSPSSQSSQTFVNSSTTSLSSPSSIYSSSSTLLTQSEEFDMNSINDHVPNEIINNPHLPTKPNDTTIHNSTSLNGNNNNNNNSTQALYSKDSLEHLNTKDNVNSEKSQQQQPYLKTRSSMDLFECIESRTRIFTEYQARYIFKQILSAVNYLYSNDIVHRDLKDENILIDQYLNIKITDFGAASYLKNSKKGCFVNKFLGTLNYAPPEILKGEQFGTITQEIFSLGIILYLLIFGEIPYENPSEIIYSPNLIHKIPKGKTCSREAFDLIKWMLQPRPENRPSLNSIFNHSWMNKI